MYGKGARVTERERGEVAEWIASVKVVATDTALRVTAGVFEVTGSRATRKNVGLDRFWRDVRTHTLHDPVAYKNRELGEFVLLDKVRFLVGRLENDELNCVDSGADLVYLNLDMLSLATAMQFATFTLSNTLNRMSSHDHFTLSRSNLLIQKLPN